MKRKGKFYSKNEKETLKKLGLTPAPQSGAGWIIKEDGEDENVMVQLKSTDSSSYRIEMLDIKKLEYHANISNKIPIFLIQFLKQDKLYALVNIDDIGELSYIYRKDKKEKSIIITEDTEAKQNKIIKSSIKSRSKFFEERSEIYNAKRNNRK